MRGGILALVSLSLVGVGFSSWLITGKGSPSRDAPLDSIGADGDFSDINKFIKYDKRSSSVFEFCQDGLIKNGMIVDDGEVKINFSIETQSSIKDHLFKDSSLLTLQTFLYDKNNIFYSNGTDSLFTTFFSKKSKVQVGVSNDKLNVQYSEASDILASENYCKVIMNIPQEYLDNKNLYFYRKYPFVFDSEQFKEKIFSKLQNQTLEFSFKAEAIL